VRKRLNLDPGDLLVIEEHEDSFVVRKAADVARGFRGYLKGVESERDLAAELISDRREEMKHEEAEAKAPARRRQTRSQTTMRR
jgi:bifunctional DNA-binding transcriptional regulator/antitoxin component of YhaV-PrlF toxin-antitoxin module